jgi:large subunit ribosomal protein L25
MKKVYLHLDFQAVKMDEKIHSTVPVHALIGEPIGVTHGGILEQPLYAIDVACTPSALPEVISVNIKDLDLEQSLHVKDLIMPEGVTAVTSQDAVVFHIMRPAAETVAVTAETEETTEKK